MKEKEQARVRCHIDKELKAIVDMYQEDQAICFSVEKVRIDY